MEPTAQPLASRVPVRTGLSLEVLEWGDAKSEHTVLLVHGYLDLAWGWSALVGTGLLDRYHLLVPTMRGHGGSDWIGAGAAYYFLDYVADVASLVDDRARERLSIVGHSMGGTIASYFAGSFPDRVEKLALLEGLSVPEGVTGPARMRESVRGRQEALAQRGTQGAPGGKRFASLEDAAARMRRHDPALDPALSLRLAEHGCVRLPSGEWAWRHDPLLAPRTPIGFELDIAARFWSQITSDLLYVEGGASAFRLGGDMRARRLGAFSGVRSRREETIPGAGHMMIRNAPTETARLLADFLG